MLANNGARCARAPARRARAAARYAQTAAIKKIQMIKI